MNIDFHHAATYVIARMAGFAHHDAEVVAYAAQYVDDATNSGVVQFRNGLLYRRITTAHQAIERANWRRAENLLSWLPFHFLPGNDGLGTDAPVAERGRERLVCRKDSPVARAMTEECIREGKARVPYALHRLGITAHVYADTWAHDGFVGLIDHMNTASGFREAGTRRLLWSARVRGLRALVRVVHWEKHFPGHGMTLGFPDLPHLSWSYRNWENRVVERKHPALFLEAAEGLYGVFVRFLKARGSPASEGELAPEHRDVLLRMFAGGRGLSVDKRHANWLRAIADGTFGFTETLTYQAKGTESWKHRALGTTAKRDKGDEVYEYHPGFLSSDWFLFHEAAKLHRSYVLEVLLPQFGLAITRRQLNVERGSVSA